MTKQFQLRAILIAACLFTFSCADDGADPSDAADQGPDFQTPVGDGPRVLVDLYHTYKQNPVDYRLEKGEYRYQGVFGFWRAFNHMERNGYTWASFRSQPLTPELLEDYDSLFINLVSSDRPDFSDDEVETIIEYVRNGGGLFIIADHTNVYRHAERVNRFLMPMGIEVLYHTATDVPPVYSVGGTGWILVRDFADHPVTRNVEVASLQTGGPMRSDGSGVGFTSTCESAPPVGCSFADLWDPENNFGFFDDWTWNGDIEAEPIGPLEVVTAHEYGEGRIVVVGDQNIFGDAWLHFANNFELFMNSIDWISKKSDDRAWLSDIKPMGLNIVIPSDNSNHAFGKNNNAGLFAFFTNGNRDHDVTMKAVESFDDSDDVVMVLDPKNSFEPDEVATMRRYLDDGKRVVLMFESDEISEATIELLRELAPDFSLTVNDQVSSVNDPTFGEAVPTQVDGVHLMKSDYLEFVTEDNCESEEGCIPPTMLGSFIREDSNGYLLDVTSDWGEPFLQAGDVDVARIKKVSKGELIVFVQDRFFRGLTMGSYIQRPADRAPTQPCEKCYISGVRGVHHLQFSLQDYLKTPVSAEPASE